MLLELTINEVYMLKIIFGIFLIISFCSTAFAEEMVGGEDYEIDANLIENEEYKITMDNKTLNITFHPTNQIKINQTIQEIVSKSIDSDGHEYFVDEGSIMVASATIVGFFSVGLMYIRIQVTHINNLLIMMLGIILLTVISLHFLTMLFIVNDSFTVGWYTTVIFSTISGIILLVIILFMIDYIPMRIRQQAGMEASKFFKHFPEK